MAISEPEGFAPIRTESHDTESHGNAIIRTLSNSPVFLERKPSRPYESDSESGANEKIINTDGEWQMMPDLKAMQDQDQKDNIKDRKLGVTWKNLTVKGIGADAAINENFGSQFNIPRSI